MRLQSVFLSLFIIASYSKKNLIYDTSEPRARKFQGAFKVSALILAGNQGRIQELARGGAQTD